MPYIPEHRRSDINENGYGHIQKPGEICWVVYREMLRYWNNDIGWTTATEIKNRFVYYPEETQLMQELVTQCPYSWKVVLKQADMAWEVFFALEVLPYEIQKRTENGEVV